MLSTARKITEIVAVALLTAMFAAFLLQIFTRYVLDNPLGWTSEACVILYIWTVFWTSAFLLNESDHVSFSMLSDAVSARTRRVFTVIGHIMLGLAFASALPAIVDYVSFMKIDSTPVMRIRFDAVYSIFPVFVVAVIIRSVLALYGAFRRQADVKPVHPSEAL